MNFNNLRPAWSQLKVQNTLFTISKEDVIELIDSQEKQIAFHLHRMASNVAIFSLLVIFCQGG